MKKTYNAVLKHYVLNGIRFTAFVFPRSGSYFVTDNAAQQALIESTRAFATGQVYLVDTPDAPRRVTPPRPLSPDDTADIDVSLTSYSTDSLQRARDIIYALMEARGIERTACPNRKAILNAAERLGIDFPNL